MFVLIALLGIISLLLIVAASVAYLALPRGRLCPQCGGTTSPVVLQRLLKILSHWVQWRWCARCGWEGPGLRGPDVGALDLVVRRASHPRRRATDVSESDIPDIGDVQTFQWRSGDQEERREDRSDHPSGFQWQVGGEPVEPDETPDHPSGFTWQPGEEAALPNEPQAPGFYFRAKGDRRRPQFKWGRGANRGRRTADNPPARPARPWHLAWLVSKDAPGFQWKDKRG